MYTVYDGQWQCIVAYPDRIHYMLMVIYGISIVYLMPNHTWNVQSERQLQRWPLLQTTDGSQRRLGALRIYNVLLNSREQHIQARLSLDKSFSWITTPYSSWTYPSSSRTELQWNQSTLLCIIWAWQCLVSPLHGRCWEYYLLWRRSLLLGSRMLCAPRLAAQCSLRLHHACMKHVVDSVNWFCSVDTHRTWMER